MITSCVSKKKQPTEIVAFPTEVIPCVTTQKCMQLKIYKTILSLLHSLLQYAPLRIQDQSILTTLVP